VADVDPEGMCACTPLTSAGTFLGVVGEAYLPPPATAPFSALRTPLPFRYVVRVLACAAVFLAVWLLVQRFR
jgi:hypothetical protein